MIYKISLNFKYLITQLSIPTWTKNEDYRKWQYDFGFGNPVKNNDNA